jgi:hypothetical protein
MKINEWRSIMNELNKELLERLDVLAVKMGVGAEHLWGALIRQGMFEGCYAVAIMLVCVAYCLSVKKISIPLSKRSDAAKDNTADEALYGALSVASVLLVAVAIIAFFVNAHNAYSLFNPEFYALKQLVSISK